MPSEPEGQRPIAERIHDVLAGYADPRNEEVVAEWRSASPDNERLFATCARVFEMERDLAEAVDIGAPPEARDVVWLAEARESARKLADGSPKRARGGWWRTGLGIAAALALAAGAVLLHRSTTQETAELRVDMFLTGDEDRMTMRLTDGSIVRLAPGSQVRLLPSSSERMVELDGRAYFAVPHDPARPFVVRTRAGDVRVVGTRFQADAAGDSTHVLVVEGEVVISGRSHETKVEAQQIGRIRQGLVGPVALAPDPGRMLEWMGNFVVFQATPLEAALDEIAEKYDVRFEILQPGYAERDLTMWFADRPLSEIVDVICAVLGAQCSTEGEVIRIGG